LGGGWWWGTARTALVHLEAGVVVLSGVELPEPDVGLDSGSRVQLEGTVARSIVTAGSSGAESIGGDDLTVGVDVDGTAGQVVGTVVTGGPGEVNGCAGGGGGHWVCAGVAQGLAACSGAGSGAESVSVTGDFELLEVTGVTVSDLDKEGVGVNSDGDGGEGDESEEVLELHLD